MAKRPNFLIILADDLGYSDIGPFGSEIPTPNLDRLSKEGVRFNDFHASSFCSPTRSMIMSGTDCHLAGLGVMSEFAGGRDRWQRPGHEGYLNRDVAALSEVLQDNGYYTMISGKWHLGFLEGQIPKDRGFSRSWSMLPGCSNHFGWEPYWEEKDRPNIAAHHPMIYAEEDVRYIPKPNLKNSSDGFYSTQFYTENLIKYMKEYKSGSEKDKPFFAYLPFAAPHWPLQCYPEDRDMFKGKYDDGPAELRLRRIDALKKLGLVKPDVIPHPVVAPECVKEWQDMTPHEQRMSARIMECFAGMIHAIDREVGRIVDYIESIGELNNTVVIFMSDNGAEGQAIESEAVMGPRMAAAIDKWYDNSYENLGNHNSWAWYGPRWAQASTAPNRLAKRFTTEGGIRVPMLMRYPKFKQYSPGTIGHSFMCCMDIMPTFLELAGITHPNPNPATPLTKAPYRNRFVYPMRGRSWVKYLTDGTINSTGKVSEQDAIWGPGDGAVGWEMHGCAALRNKNWKIVNMPATEYGTGGWELFDLDKDQGEINDLSKSHPEKMKEMLNYWDQYVEETGTFFGPLVDWASGKNGPANWDPEYVPPPVPYVQGNIVEDQKAWMKLGQGQRLNDLRKPGPTDIPP